VIQCGNLQGGHMGKLGGRHLAMIFNSAVIEMYDDMFLISYGF
jgi:hypothetical protein